MSEVGEGGGEVGEVCGGEYAGTCEPSEPSHPLPQLFPPLFPPQIL